MAHDPLQPQNGPRSSVRKNSLNWAFAMERVTGIEPALSAWESAPSGPVTCPDLREVVSASDRERPLVTEVNGPLMARLLGVQPALMTVPRSSPVLLDSCRPSGRGRCARLAKRPRAAWPLTRRPRPRQSSSEDDAHHLLIRRFLCGHSNPFRSVRDLGYVPARC
jgi:hypothetical protein